MPVLDDVGSRPRRSPERAAASRAAIGPVRHGDDAIVAAATALWSGLIVAVVVGSKGARGFFRLAVDAAHADSVARLRARAGQTHRPLPVMARSLDHLERVTVLDDAARAALQSAARPLVMAPARPSGSLAENVALRARELGVCLPATRLQQRLLHDGPPLQVLLWCPATASQLTADDGGGDGIVDQAAAIADLVLLFDGSLHAPAISAAPAALMRGLARSCA